MINLIKNEIIKIFKKKSIYITLIITLVFIIAVNLLCKYGSSFSDGNTYSDEYAKYLSSRLESLDYTKASDNSEYISAKSNLEIIEIEKKYGSNSWQSIVVSEKIYPIIEQYNTYKYALEKDEQKFKEAEEEYNKYMKFLETDNWKYFAQADLEEVNKNIKEAEELKKSIEDKIQLSQQEYRIYDYNLQKQVLNWRLEKDISYGSEDSRLLTRYYNAALGVYDYEHSTQENKYEDKLQYQENLKIANENKYAIENDIKISNGNDLKGLLGDFFTNYELFIVVIIVMIAGSIVSEEFNKGTIKLLLVKPYSRVQILLSKLITCITMIFISVAIIALMQVVVGGFVFGFSDLSSPMIAYNFNTNSVMEMNIFKYIGVTLLHKLPLYLILTAIAFTFSTVFTNTPVAIVISLLGYMSTEIINMLVKEFNIVFMKFFITPNWDLTQYMFGKLPTFNQVNFKFSIGICILYFVALIVPTFLVFRKKNIKNV